MCEHENIEYIIHSLLSSLLYTFLSIFFHHLHLYLHRRPLRYVIIVICVYMIEMYQIIIHGSCTYVYVLDDDVVCIHVGCKLLSNQIMRVLNC